MKVKIEVEFEVDCRSKLTDEQVHDITIKLQDVCLDYVLFPLKNTLNRYGKTSIVKVHADIENTFLNPVVINVDSGNVVIHIGGTDE